MTPRAITQIAKLTIGTVVSLFVIPFGKYQSKELAFFRVALTAKRAFFADTINVQSEEFSEIVKVNRSRFG